MVGRGVRALAENASGSVSSTFCSFVVSGAFRAFQFSFTISAHMSISEAMEALDHLLNVRLNWIYNSVYENGG